MNKKTSRLGKNKALSTIIVLILLIAMMPANLHKVNADMASPSEVHTEDEGCFMPGVKHAYTMGFTSIHDGVECVETGTYDGEDVIIYEYPVGGCVYIPTEKFAEGYFEGWYYYDSDKDVYLPCYYKPTEPCRTGNTDCKYGMFGECRDTYCSFYCYTHYKNYRLYHKKGVKCAACGTVTDYEAYTAPCEPGNIDCRYGAYANTDCNEFCEWYCEEHGNYVRIDHEFNERCLYCERERQQVFSPYEVHTEACTHPGVKHAYLMEEWAYIEAIDGVEYRWAGIYDGEKINRFDSIGGGELLCNEGLIANCAFGWCYWDGEKYMPCGYGLEVGECAGYGDRVGDCVYNQMYGCNEFGCEWYCMQHYGTVSVFAEHVKGQKCAFCGETKTADGYIGSCEMSEVFGTPCKFYGYSEDEKCIWDCRSHWTTISVLHKEGENCAACGYVAPTPTPVPTATNTPVPTATPTLTNSPSLSPTSSPTATTGPTATNTPVPTATNTPIASPTATPTPTPCTHGDKTKHDATESTCGKRGNVEFWTCNTCGKSFDAAGKVVDTSEVLLPLSSKHTYSDEWKIVRPATATENGKKETSCTKCGCKKTEIIPATGVTVTPEPEDEATKTLDTEAVVAPDVPVESAGFNNSKKDFIEADGIFTEEEKQAIANGEEAKVFLAVLPVDIALIPKEEQVKIAEEAVAALGEKVEIEYIDIALFKAVGEGNASSVHEPGTKIDITIEVSEEMTGEAGDGKTRVYSVIRVHNGVVEVLPATFNPVTNEITFSTDKFSTYAVVYSDEEIKVEVTAQDNKTTLTQKGETVQLNAQVVPAEISQEVTFESSNPSVATVDADGKVTAVGNGTAVITVKTAAGTATAEITVKVDIANNPPTGIPDYMGMTLAVMMFAFATAIGIAIFTKRKIEK